MNSSLHLAPDQRIESGEGFVQKPELRLYGKRTGDADALLLPARKLVGEGVFPALEPDQLDHRLGPRQALLRILALYFQRERHVLQHGQMRQQAEILEDHPHLVAANVDEIGIGSLQQIATVEKNFTGRGLHQTERQRTMVDLPEPESPMMMKISPTWTSKLTSLAATT